MGAFATLTVKTKLSAVLATVAWVLAGCSTDPPPNTFGTQATERSAEPESAGPETPEPAGAPELLATTPAPDAAPTPPPEGIRDCRPDPVMPTASSVNWPDHIPEHERPILAQQMRSALWDYKDERCPCGQTASWRNRGSAEVKRAPPTPWTGPEVAIQRLMTNLRIDQASPLRLKAMVLNQPIRWFSDLDGEIGRESELLIPGRCLTPGTHRIEARQMRHGEIVALGSLEVFVQTVLEAIKESARTPDVRPVLEKDWVLSGPNQTVELQVRNYGGGKARAMTMVVRGLSLESASGPGWRCKWHQLDDGQKTSEKARAPSALDGDDPCGALDCCIGIIEATPSAELRCTYERDLPGAQASLPLRLRVSSDPSRQSPPGNLVLHAAVSVAGEINTQDNESELWVEVLQEERIDERLLRKPFEYATITNDPEFSVRRPGRNYLHAGPMLVRVDETRIDVDRDAVVMDLYAAVQLAIPNVRREQNTTRVRLWLDEILAKDGRSLVSDAAELGAVRPEGHAYRKSIALDAGVHSWEVGAVKGRVEVSVPLRVSRIGIDQPARGKRFGRNGVTLAVVGTKADSVSLRLGGETGRVLEVRALNAQGEPLALVSGGHAPRSSGAWEHGNHELKAYGRIAGIEVFVADESKTLTFPFSLSPSPMREKVDTSRLEDVFEPFSMAKFKKEYEDQAIKDVLAYVASARFLTRDEPVLATQLASAFFLELIRVNQDGALNPGIRINLPRLPNLEYTFGHLIFQIDYVHLRDGTIISPKTVAELRKSPEAHDGLQFKLPPNHAEAAWSTYVPAHGLSGARRAWHTWLILPLGLAERDDVSMLEGRLTYRIPKSIQWHAFQSANPGERIETPKLLALLRSVGRDTALEIARGGDRVVAIRWLDDESTETGIVMLSSLPVPPTASWTHRFRTGNRHNLAIAVGDHFQTAEYPVRLRIPPR